MTYNQGSEICSLASVVEQFIQERKFLKGVSPATLEWYKYAFKAFAPVLAVPHQSTTAFKAAVIQRIEALQGQGRGNKNVSINTYLRCLKTFLLWCHTEGIVKEPVKLSWLKEENKILATLSLEHLRTIFAYKPTANRHADIRLFTLVCLLLDTGVRINEAFSLSPNDVDFDNLILAVKGKGGKHRLVPFSVELRKLLWKYHHGPQRVFSSDLFFCTKNQTKLSQRDFLRDFKKLGKRLSITGIRVSAHTCRHTFAVSWLRRGGDLFMLQRILGHSSIETTTCYLKSLGVQDIQRVHAGISLLGSSRA